MCVRQGRQVQARQPICRAPAAKVNTNTRAREGATRLNTIGKELALCGLLLPLSRQLAGRRGDNIANINILNILNILITSHHDLLTNISHNHQYLFSGSSLSSHNTAVARSSVAIVTVYGAPLHSLTPVQFLVISRTLLTQTVHKVRWPPFFCCLLFPTSASVSSRPSPSTVFSPNDPTQRSDSTTLLFLLSSP